MAVAGFGDLSDPGPAAAQRAARRGGFGSIGGVEEVGFPGVLAGGADQHHRRHPSIALIGEMSGAHRRSPLPAASSWSARWRSC